MLYRLLFDKLAMGQDETIMLHIRTVDAFRVKFFLNSVHF